MWIELPMVIRCPQCQHTRSVSESLIPSGASVATCPVCGCRFRFRNPHGRADAEAPPAKPPASADTAGRRTAAAPPSTSPPGGPASGSVAPDSAADQIVDVRDPSAGQPFPEKFPLPRTPAGRVGMTPAAAGHRLSVEIPPAGRRVPEPAAGGADDVGDTSVRRRRVLEPALPEAGGVDVWDAVARLGDAEPQSPEAPRETGAETARAADEPPPGSAGVRREHSERRAVSELRGLPDNGAFAAAQAEGAPPERPPDLLRRLFGRNKKKQRAPAATLEIMLPGLPGNDEAGSTAAGNDGRRQNAPPQDAETPAGGMPPADTRIPGLPSPTLPDRPDPGIPYRLAQTGAGIPRQPSPTGADIPGRPVSRADLGIPGVPSDTFFLSPLPDAASSDDASGNARARARFPYAEEGPDPEARVEQDLRMLHDARNAVPQRDLGRLREFPDDVPGDEVGSGLGGAGGVPWENPAFYGWVGGFTATLRGVMFKGPEFFSSLGNEWSPALGYLFFVLAGYLCILGSSAWILAAEMLLPGVLPLPPGRTVLPLLLLSAPIALGLMLLFSAGFIRVMMRIFAPDRADFVPIYKVVCYAPAPFVLCIVPFVGPPLAAIWFLVSMMTGCRNALGISLPLALFAALPPALLMLVAVAVCFL